MDARVSNSGDVLIELPSEEKAPAFRESLTARADMRIHEVADRWVVVAPREGAGNVYPYFSLDRLCDAQTEINDDTWAPLIAYPTLRADSEISLEDVAGGADWRKLQQEWVASIDVEGRPEAALAAIDGLLVTLSLAETPRYLTRQARELLKAYPDGSFWFFRADGLLQRRFALARALLTLALAPDVIDLNDPETRRLPQLHTLQAHSLTHGSSFQTLLDPLLLTFSPGALGFVFDWMPHGLVFLIGLNGSLARPFPTAPAALYEPNLQKTPGFSWKDSEFFEGIETADAESLLKWWVARLNVVYSYLADPTNFSTRLGHHWPEKQTGWFLTFERLLADLLLIQTGFQGSELARQQAAFDLLDKAEALLGFGKDEPSRGFERILRRASMLERLEEIWQRLPSGLQTRFSRHAKALYDGIYEGVAAHAFEHRVSGRAIKVGAPGEKLTALPLESYVPELVRAVRNSAHGFIYVLTDGKARRDRQLLASHDGKLPPQVPDLAALIGFALVADFERVIDGTWLPKPR